MVAELSAECPTQQLYGAFVSEAEIPIADIGFDLTPWVEKGFSVGVVRQAEMAWWFLFDCLKNDSLKTMARHAGSPSKAFRVLKDHFLPLSQESDSCTRRETEVNAHAFERESRNLLASM